MICRLNVKSAFWTKQNIKQSQSWQRNHSLFMKMRWKVKDGRRLMPVGYYKVFFTGLSQESWVKIVTTVSPYAVVFQDLINYKYDKSLLTFSAAGRFLFPIIPDGKTNAVWVRSITGHSRNFQFHVIVTHHTVIRMGEIHTCCSLWRGAHKHIKAQQQYASEHFPVLSVQLCS